MKMIISAFFLVLIHSVLCTGLHQNVVSETRRSTGKIRVMNAELRPFRSAKKDCERHGGHLATYHSQEELNTLKELAKTKRLRATQDNVWAGLINEDGSEWKFTDGSAMDYEPDKTYLDGSRYFPMCAALYNQYVIRRDCGYYYFYICEYDNPPVTPQCPEDYRPFQNMCYARVDDAKDFRDAQSHCEGKHAGNLAAFHSKEQYDFLQGLLDSSRAWIGLNKEDSSSWTFTDGSRMNHVPNSLYLVSSENEECMTLDPSQEILEHRACNDKNPFVCQTCVPGSFLFTQYEYLRKLDEDVYERKPSHSETYCQVRCAELGSVCVDFVFKTSDSTCWIKHPCPVNICPENATPHQGKCLALTTEGKSFNDAEDDCKAQGGHLAAFHSFEDLIFLQGLVGGTEDVWIGLTDKDDNQWMFTDGSPIDYVPNTTRIDNQPHPGCAHLRQDLVVDSDCNNNNPYICQVGIVENILGY